MRIRSLKLKTPLHDVYTHDQYELEEFIYSMEKRGAGVWFDSRTGVWHFIWEDSR